MTNGLYTLLVQATDINGQQASDQRTYLIDGDLKVGNFSFTLVDLEIPMSGVPIQVNRTYDSRRRGESLDFGYGWSLDYQNVRVDESRPLGAGWALNEYPSGPLGLIPLYCVEPMGAPTVTVTLPDGSVERFTVGATPHCNEASPILDVNLTFTAEGDTQSTLALPESASLRLVDNHLEFLGEGAPYDTDRYTLTTRHGYVYQLNQAFGIETITTPNGQTLTYTDAGIFHSEGKSVLFTRNSDGRITDITDPAGQVVMHYDYNYPGDLRYAQDAAALAAASNGVEYTYNRHHGLVDIIDPLGRPVLKNHYDEAGRLYAQEDGDGNWKYFDHNLSANSTVVTDLDGRSTVYDYDDQGHVLFETQVIGDGSYVGNLTTAYTYDANGNQETKTIGTSTWTTLHNATQDVLYTEDPEGNRVTYENYNARGQEGRIVDERGNAYEMHYDAVGNLYQIDGPVVTDPDSGQTSQQSAGSVINAQGQVESTTDMRDQTTTYTYYPVGHAWAGWKATESSDLTGTVTYTYDANGNVKTEARARTVNSVVISETTSFDYDTQNRLIKTTYGDGSYTETTFDLAGNKDRERDRFGNWTDYDFDAYRRLVKTTYADSTVESHTYTKEGLLETVTDRSGQVTRYVYDDAGREWQVINEADGSYTETRYTQQGWVKQQWDENRNLTEYEYDLAGNRTAVIRHIDGRTLRHTYDYYENGELLSETDPLLHTTTYVLNALDQRITTQYHNGTTTGSRYDTMGARTQQIDQNSTVTQYGYDAIGRLKTVTPQVLINGLPVPDTAYSYDEVGNKLSQTDANGHTTTWAYDLHGRVIQRTLPEGMSESFVYDDAQHQVTHTDFNGDITTTHDEMGRVSTIVYSKDGRSESYTYWPDDNIKTVTDENGTTQYFYDGRHRLDYLIQPNGIRIDYDYDLVGNRKQVKVSQGITVLSQVDYTFDALNRLKTTTDDQGTTTYQYDDAGNLDTVTYPNGVVTNYDYNTVNQLTDVTTRDALNTVLESYSYQLTATGHRDSVTDHTGRYTDYVYDGLYRLTDEIVTDSLLGNYSASYQYDWAGNRTYSIEDGVHTSYLYDSNDRLQSQGGTQYGYDNNGNLLGELTDGLLTQYQYNSQNRLIAVDKAGQLTGYGYNANGIRTSKTEGGITTYYIVDEQRDYAQVLIESDGTNTTSYTYGLDLISQDRSGQISYYQYDGLGSTRALTDSLGNITDTYDYTAYGELANQSGSTLNSYLYTGEQFDQEAGHYYLRARSYNPGVGRFTQMDTWNGIQRIPLSLNKYIYTEGDPVNNVDPSGNFLVSVSAGNSIRGILATIAVQAPRLGFTFLTSSAGHVVGIAATTCVANYAATHFGIVMPSAEFKGCDGGGHSGRWQAQGGGLEKSAAWNQAHPLTLTEGLALLDSLEMSLRPKDRKARAAFFEQARIYARRLASAGGISAANFGGSKSFPTRNQPSSYPRVDLEINRGHAFTNE